MFDVMFFLSANLFAPAGIAARHAFDLIGVGAAAAAGKVGNLSKTVGGVVTHVAGVRSLAGAAGLVGGAFAAVTAAGLGLHSYAQGQSGSHSVQRVLAEKTHFPVEEIQQMERVSKGLNIPLQETEETVKGLAKSFWDMRTGGDAAFEMRKKFAQHGIAAEYDELQAMARRGATNEQLAARWDEMQRRRTAAQAAEAARLLDTPESAARLSREGPDWLKGAGKGTELEVEAQHKLNRALSFTFDKFQSLANLVSIKSHPRSRDMWKSSTSSST